MPLRALRVTRAPRVAPPSPAAFSLALATAFALAFVLSCVLPFEIAQAQEALIVSKSEALPPDVASLVEAERAFARRALEAGIRDAFYENFADNSVMFRPGPINAHEFLKGRPSNKGPLLLWGPSYAELSTSGDLGWTTGPAELRLEKDKAPEWYGRFTSVWQKQADGKWKVLIDHGCDLPKPEPESLTARRVGGRPGGAKPLSNSAHEKTRNALADAERSYEALLVSKGLGGALEAHGDRDVRVYRWGKPTAHGATAAGQAFADEWSKGIASWSPEIGAVSKAGDLGYTYGSVELKSSASKGSAPADTAQRGPERRAFVRVWRNVGGTWKLAIDVTTPFQES
ncbi:MAG: YybH family protein [Candidatus Eiseniibacteriota bacterium]